MTNDFEIQLDKIRVDLYEQTKELSNNEVAHITNENAKKIAEQFGINIGKNSAAPAVKRTHLM